ncbi:MIR motif-containing protein [Catenaria anguillulae PL171]|uniref:MIR motif-containing protein n=1 Tax=Catenaria anguillulae PL171 TaxID=765915 RepID=A0A1Y2HNK6_9FUNG|nr:MIR motif-containing protein [Catenaria anguillulae PL171]
MKPRTMSRSMHPLALLLGLAAAIICAAVSTAAEATIEIDEEFSRVTCGSLIKLTHVATGHKLHSHKIPYGSGSGQQSVTAFPGKDDPNSLWLVEAGNGQPCARGETIKCGSVIRLVHTATMTRLHSHLHNSPLSGNQEVSAYPHVGANNDDNWKLTCKSSSTKFWTRELPVFLMHESTSKYLHASANHRYNQPIPGQLEVSGIGRRNSNAEWAAQEGVYFASQVPKA